MSNLAPIAVMATAGATPRPPVAARGGASTANPVLSGNQVVLNRFRPTTGLMQVQQVSSTWSADPSAPFAASNGMVAAPNVDLQGGAAGGPFTSYGLAFNAPIMHVYTETSKALVNILA